MCELVDKLINDSINPHSAADELELSILRIAKDEMVSVEVRELFPADASGDLCITLAVARLKANRSNSLLECD